MVHAHGACGPPAHRSISFTCVRWVQAGDSVRATALAIPWPHPTDSGNNPANAAAENMKKLIFLVVLSLFVTAVVIAVRELPWWAILGGVVLIGLLGKFLISLLLKRLFLAPFRAKGSVLKGATAVVHDVAIAKPPARPVMPEFDSGKSASSELVPEAVTPSDASADPSEHYLLEVTITPAPSGTGFSHWEPGELMLVKPESVLGPDLSETVEEDDALSFLHGIHYQEEGVWKEDDGIKITGSKRLRIHFAVRRGIRRLKFRYYFEDFGAVELP